MTSKSLLDSLISYFEAKPQNFIKAKSEHTILQGKCEVKDNHDLFLTMFKAYPRRTPTVPKLQRLLLEIDKWSENTFSGVETILEKKSWASRDAVKINHVWIAFRKRVTKKEKGGEMNDLKDALIVKRKTKAREQTRSLPAYPGVAVSTQASESESDAGESESGSESDSDVEFINDFGGEIQDSPPPKPSRSLEADFDGAASATPLEEAPLQESQLLMELDTQELPGDVQSLDSDTEAPMAVAATTDDKHGDDNETDSDLEIIDEGASTGAANGGDTQSSDIIVDCSESNAVEPKGQKLTKEPKPTETVEKDEADAKDNSPVDIISDGEAIVEKTEDKHEAAAEDDSMHTPQPAKGDTDEKTSGNKKKKKLNKHWQQAEGDMLSEDTINSVKAVATENPIGLLEQHKKAAKKAKDSETKDKPKPKGKAKAKGKSMKAGCINVDKEPKTKKAPKKAPKKKNITDDDDDQPPEKKHKSNDAEEEVEANSVEPPVESAISTGSEESTAPELAPQPPIKKKPAAKYNFLSDEAKQDLIRSLPEEARPVGKEVIQNSYQRISKDGGQIEVNFKKKAFWVTYYKEGLNTRDREEDDDRQLNFQWSIGCKTAWEKAKDMAGGGVFKPKAVPDPK